MSFMSGGGGGDDPTTPVMPGYGNKQLMKYMASWRKQQRSKQGMESTILGDMDGGATQQKTLLGDAWLTK